MYNKLEGADSWAQNTLNDHKKDIRFYVYTKEQFEKGETHDDIWNCAQLQLLQEGKIHGYMRMYWCKKILEWTETPEKAIEIALYLNDTYSLDGSDPNGFVGIYFVFFSLKIHFKILNYFRCNVVNLWCSRSWVEGTGYIWKDTLYG